LSFSAVAASMAWGYGNGQEAYRRGLGGSER